MNCKLLYKNHLVLCKFICEFSLNIPYKSNIIPKKYITIGCKKPLISVKSVILKYSKYRINKLKKIIIMPQYALNIALKIKIGFTIGFERVKENIKLSTFFGGC